MSDIVMQESCMVKIRKWLTPVQSNELRSAIYDQFPQMRERVQIVSAGGRVQVAGIRGYILDPQDADAVAALIDNFGTTPETEMDAALFSAVTTAAVMGAYKAPSKRSRSLRRKGGWS